MDKFAMDDIDFGLLAGDGIATRPVKAGTLIFQEGDKAELKPGAHIIIFGAAKKDDGTLEANRVNVGRDGITPPM